ncbi:uncharacterized protein LOC128984061 [Macrosteles quadrilineatus]|uniref:uncharacterized protein LOC128984061 n=1 Tax=Macrosteles quadrilineatus TaxID=74068 RepID=UPI0023E1A718|nr:uncharacterized protein LOC128984061 [Macrosteles quadrilineatus]
MDKKCDRGSTSDLVDEGPKPYQLGYDPSLTITSITRPVAIVPPATTTLHTIPLNTSPSTTASATRPSTDGVWLTVNRSSSSGLDTLADVAMRRAMTTELSGPTQPSRRVQPVSLACTETVPEEHECRSCRRGARIETFRRRLIHRSMNNPAFTLPAAGRISTLTTELLTIAELAGNTLEGYSYACGLQPTVISALWEDLRSTLEGVLRQATSQMDNLITERIPRPSVSPIDSAAFCRQQTLSADAHTDINTLMAVTRLSAFSTNSSVNNISLP